MVCVMYVQYGIGTGYRSLNPKAAGGVGVVIAQGANEALPARFSGRSSFRGFDQLCPPLGLPLNNVEELFLNPE
jgi:hypothetical protein